MATYAGKLNVGGTALPIGSTLYGTCATGAGTVAKVGTLANFDTLLTGVTIHIKFTNANTATNPTLNVNSTGAKPIMRYGTTRAGNNANLSWNAGAVISFTYDGTNWVMNDWLNATYSNATQSAAGLMSAADKTYLDSLDTSLPSLFGLVVARFNITATSINALSGKVFTCRLPSYADYYGMGIIDIYLNMNYPIVLHSWRWPTQDTMYVYIYNTSSTAQQFQNARVDVQMMYARKQFVEYFYTDTNPWTADI